MSALDELENKRERTSLELSILLANDYSNLGRKAAEELAALRARLAAAEKLADDAEKVSALPNDMNYRADLLKSLRDFRKVAK
jgi:hypothetical protein